MRYRPPAKRSAVSAVSGDLKPVEATMFDNGAAFLRYEVKEALPENRAVSHAD
ncbi:hypothetical protein [Actinoplanes auranticolor]|uniref:Uncharacterized protein n=1 Tax=Actinoplanes auranticolor TaxID=47988 RepID=A0A919ST04_9ACTN|nr:hypothetical protein [Actinoplanes auranticolor]GIM77044.1 hypothetical protein Aau02nite_73890 [Actinoplanes auranticolor]